MTPFQAKAPQVMGGLIRDLALVDIGAAGIVGQTGVESGLRAVQEIHPRAGRGGFGWFQWTGVRRVNFESYCKTHGLSETSDEANYGFLIFELRGPYAHALQRLRFCTTVESATYTFEADYEMAGVVALANRIKFAKEALALYRASNPTPIEAPKEAIVTESQAAPAAPAALAAAVPAIPATNMTTILTNEAVTALVNDIWPTLVKDEPLLGYLPEANIESFLERIARAVVNTAIGKLFGAAAISVPGAAAPLSQGSAQPMGGVGILSDIFNAMSVLARDMADIKMAQAAQIPAVAQPPAQAQIAGPAAS